VKFEDAQKDMNFSYFGGGTGVLVSGLVWCVAGGVALLYSNQSSMLTLFFAGMLCILFNANFVVGAFIGGITEIVFALVIFSQSKGLVIKVA